MALSVGTIVNNRYRIASKLGEGGYGVVYRAWDLRLNIPVALKENQESEVDFRDQFTREARILASLNHPHLPRVTDYFEDGSILYLVMDFIDGADLEDMVKANGRLPETDVLRWASQVMEALIYLHHQNPPIIHRDIKPKNIRINKSGNVFLLDFGIAKLFNPGSKTVRGARGYTPPYAPFEQYGSGTTDQRSDVYALGVTMYVMLSGELPPESVDRLNNLPVTPLDQIVPYITPNTVHCIQKSMELMPDNRFQTMDEFHMALLEPSKPVDFAGNKVKVPTDPSGEPITPKKVLPPPTGGYVVSKDGTGQFKTLRDAIAAAPTGAKVIIRPGDYHEALLITKPITLQAEVVDGSVVLEASGGTALKLDTPSALISGLTIRHRGGDGQKQFCVDVVSGQPIFEDCDISSSTLSSVVVHGASAQPVFRRCRFHNSGECGIMVYDHAGGSVEDCEIYGNVFSGMEVRQQSNPSVRNTRFYEGQQAGLLVWAEAQGHVDQCDFFNHHMSQIEIRDKGNPTIQSCTIRGGQSVGIFVQQKGAGTITDCDISASKLANVEVATGGTPTFTRCKIHDGSYPGIFVRDNGRGTFERCEVWGQALAGMEVRSGAAPTVRQSTFNKGLQCGIYFNEGAGGLLEDCEITSNTFSGVEIKKCVAPVLRRCTIRNNQQCGMLVWSGGRGMVEVCTIQGNSYTGVEVREGGYPTLRQCTIRSNGYQGVWVYGDSSASVEDCDLTSNKQGAFRVDPGARVIRKGNRE